MSFSMKWIDEVRGTDSMSEVARRSGIPQPTLSRQVNQGHLPFETVRDIARAYGRPVLADLIAHGLITAQDAGIDGIERALASATDEQLVVEIGKRLDVAPTSMLWDAPVSEAVERAENVSRLDDHRQADADVDLRAVASPQVDGEDDGYDTNYDD